MNRNPQFGIKTLLVLMLLVVAFFAGRLSLESKLTSLAKENQTLRDAAESIQIRQWPHIQPSINRSQIRHIRLQTPARNDSIDRGMKLDQLERIKKMKSRMREKSAEV